MDRVYKYLYLLPFYSNSTNNELSILFIVVKKALLFLSNCHELPCVWKWLSHLEELVLSYLSLEEQNIAILNVQVILSKC